MPSWSDLVNIKDIDPIEELVKQLKKISELRDGRFVIFYSSAFLQKSNARGEDISINREDMNGFMNALHGVDTKKGLILILHTPGGDPNAVETIVNYLHAKFDYIEVIVPYLAMSGGAMISLASNLLILGKQSQLGPIDPQLIINNKQHSARAIQEGFEAAKSQIEADTKMAHLWAPILQSMGPSLIVEAEKALSYSRELVKNWLCTRMFKDIENVTEKVEKIVKYFNAETMNGNESVHVHGQRIDINKLRDLGVKTNPLEENQILQDSVLTAYHIMTLVFERGPVLKFIITGNDKKWIKNQAIPILPSPPFAPPP